MDQTVGSGSDSLVLRTSQDAYRGNAQYTVSVDGRQIGGTLTAESLRSSGQSDTITVRGDWSAGNHTASVNFLNDAWDGTSTSDRNLYIDGASYNGDSVGGAARSLLSGGPANFGFTEGGSATPAPSGSTSAEVGSGSDSLVLRLSQDFYQESARYTVKVDGAQIGGVQTAQASRGSGEADTLTVKGDWGAGSHRVEVQFLNDAWGGTPSTDRNLYVDSATYNGGSVSGASQSLLSAGVAGFNFTEGGGATPTPSNPPSSGGGGRSGGLYESFEGGTGALNHWWGGVNVDLSTWGEVRLTGNGGIMERPSGRSAGHGYGTYSFEAKLDGNDPGPAILLWPGDDRWPGPEVDVVESLSDYSGRHYGTVHWNENGGDGYLFQVFDGVYGGTFHDYALRWEPGRLTWYVDGVQKATTTEHVPVDYNSGGINSVIGLMNINGNTSLTVRDAEYSPL